MATYVLVHGGNMSTETWNMLTVGKPVCTEDGHLGPKYWDGTMSFLVANKHVVFAPALGNEFSTNLSDHIGQICDLIAKKDLQAVILTGHSYGGMVITGVAANMPSRIRRLVYLDAALPDPGQSLYDILRMGLSTSSGSQPLLPEQNPAYVEKLPFDPAIIEPLKKTYILCTKSEFKDITQIAKQKIAADREGWTYIELPSSHVPMADMPDALNRLMLDAGRE